MLSVRYADSWIVVCCATGYRMEGRHLVVVLVLSFTVGTNAHFVPDCSKLEMTGATTNWYCNGMYKLYATNNCSQKNVYKQEYGIYYLYFRSGHWVVHNRSCVRSEEGGQLRIRTDADLPEDIPETAVWQEWDDSVWLANEDIELICAEKPHQGDNDNNQDLSPGAVAGITLGVLAIFTMLLLAAAIFYKQSKTTRPPTTYDQNMSSSATRTIPDDPGLTLEGATGGPPLATGIQPPAYQQSTKEEKTPLP